MTRHKPRHIISDWMPFYGRRFFHDPLVLPLSDSAKLLYIELLVHQWEHGSVPEADADVRRACSLAVRKFTPAWREVVGFFPRSGRGERQNPTLEEHRAETLSSMRDSSLRGKAAAEARWNPDGKRNADASPSAMRTQCPDMERTITPPPPNAGGRATPTASGTVSAPPPPPPRLVDALEFWGSHRPPNIAAPPKPTAELVALFAAVDRPDIRWEDVIRWVWANPYTNGLGKPRKGHASGYRAGFAWMLTPKNLATAQTLTPEAEAVTHSPQGDRDMAIVIEAMRINERKPAQLKAIQ